MTDDTPAEPRRPRNRTKKSRQAIKCHAHIERGPRKGEPCPHYAMVGQLVCKQHGGKSPQALLAAKMTLGTDRALRELARLDLEPVGNALEALQQHAAIVIAWRDRFAEVVNKLTEESIRYEGKLHGEMLRAEVQVFERAMDRCTATLSALARCQVDERLTTIRENDARMIAAAMAAALADAECDGDMAELVRIGFSRRIMAIAAGRRQIA